MRELMWRFSVWDEEVTRVGVDGARFAIRINELREEDFNKEFNWALVNM